MTPIARGVATAALSAALFGATTPFLQRFGAGAAPAATAALLYAGAALFAAVTGGRALPKTWWPRLGGVGLFGAFLAPLALAAGLARTHGTTASLLLNLEAVFTVALGALIHREPVGGRVLAGLGLVALGGVAVALDGSATTEGFTEGVGALLIAAATLSWATDNTLSRPLSDLDPASVVVGKGVAGALLSVAVATMTGAAWPSVSASVGVLVCGALGYGVSLRLYLRAQRTLGAARTGSVFAVAPFLGVVAALALGEPLGGPGVALGGVLMALGVWVHLGEDHDHEHTHEAQTHEHAHRHDDGHHEHEHEPPVVGEHSHPHTHHHVVHLHAHGEDLHHRHH
jgi:drug/metabolite transporter (DMT)-like permease